MKTNLLALAPLFFVAVSCETMNQPIADSGFDPLRAPGTGGQSDASDSHGIRPGDFVAAIVNNTAFYSKKPSQDASPDKLLNLGTTMKVVSVSTDFVKVELDTGDVGFVPSVMLAGDSPTELVEVEGIYEVYPPLPDGGSAEPLPILDPGGLPPGESIPTIIDPNAPIDLTVPSLDTPPNIIDASQIKPVEEAKPEEKKEEQPKESEKAPD